MAEDLPTCQPGRYAMTMDGQAVPKRRNPVKTRARILSAAQQAFAQSGFAQAGIREVAAAANVSPALVLRYFGSKAGLFEAALLEAMTQTGLFDGNKTGFGARMARQVASADVDLSLPAMLVLATGDAEATGIAARITRERIIAPLAAWLGPPDADTRAATIIMLSTGFVLYTRQLPVMSPPRKMIDWLAASLQAIVDQSGPNSTS